MADWPYNTKRWELVQRRVLKRDNWLCQWPGCGVLLCRGRSRPNAAVVHHIRKAKEYPALAFDLDNLEALCKRHHDGAMQSEESRGYSAAVDDDGYPIDPRHPANTGKLPKRWAFSIPKGVRPSGIPVVLVCGPPASGKSTYVTKHAAPHDTVIDFDEIRQKIGGRKWDMADGVTGRAFKYRDKVIRGLASKRRGRAWLIVTAPTEAERRDWCEALGQVTIHVMDTDKAECIRRVKAAPERAHAEIEQLRAIDRWFEAQNTPKH